MKNRIIHSILNTVLLLLFMMAAVSYKGKIFGRNTEDILSKQESIEAKILPPDSEQLEQLGLSGIELTMNSQGIWSFQEGSVDNYIINSSAFASKIYGFGGPVPMFIHLDDQKRIIEILILENNETPEFLQSVFDAGIVKQWYGKKPSEALEMKPDAVAGATMTSDAINQSVVKSISALNSVETKAVSSGFLNIKTGIAILVLVFGIIVSFVKKHKKHLRTVLLILNLAVLGFWCGKFISMQVLLGWTSNGVNLLTGGIVLIMLILSILMPLVFKKKAYYCLWICPFGSAQELAGKLKSKKYHPSKKVAKILKHSQTFITLTLFFLMWMGLASDLVNYEPFSAFLFKHASPIVLIIAATGILAAVFTPRPWCRYICPTGQVLNWAHKM